MTSLSATIAAHGAHALENAREVRRDAVGKLGEYFIDNTPIKTGLARGNWQTSIGASMTDILPVRPASEAKRELAAIAAEALADETIVIANNARHIVRLEFGWSLQAPNGMFRIGLMRWPKMLEEAAAAKR